MLYSRTSIIRPSIIRHGNSLKKNVNIFSKNGRVSSCYNGHRNVHLLRMRRRTFTAIKWVNQGVVYPIRLSGLFSYPAWLRNNGVRIIEVLPRAYKRREGMQLGKHQNSNVGGRMCMNASCSRFQNVGKNVADS